MRLLKIILVFFAIYFIRRFMQMYRVMKSLQEKQAAETNFTNQASQNKGPNAQGPTIVNADFKVID